MKFEHDLTQSDTLGQKQSHSSIEDGDPDTMSKRVGKSAVISKLKPVSFLLISIFLPLSIHH